MFGDLITCVVLLGALASLAAWIGTVLSPLILSAWERLRPFARGMFLVMGASAVMYGGAKSGATGRVSFPVVESQVAYLVDAGSYVTNDYVYINFTRRIVPDSATVYIDYCPIASTNVAEDCVNHLTTTFAALTLPHIVDKEAATNYNWLVYTDWTPGPTVVTNGVWHTYWMRDRDDGEMIVPVRSIIIENGQRILPDPNAFSDEDLQKLNSAKAATMEVTDED